MSNQQNPQQPPNQAKAVAISATASSEQTASIRQIIIGGVAFIIFLIILTFGMNAIGVEKLQTLIRDAGVFAPLVYIILKALTYIFAPLTSGPIQVVAGTLFGSVWLGTLYTLIGEVIGGSVSFWIARRYGQPVVRRFVGESGMQKIEDVYSKQLGGWISLAIARLVLFSLWDFLSYAAGLTRSVRFRTYLIVSIVLGAIPTFAFVWMGNTMIEDSGSMVFIYGLVAVLIILPILARKPLAHLMKWAENQEKNNG